MTAMTAEIHQRYSWGLFL